VELKAQTPGKACQRCQRWFVVSGLKSGDRWLRHPQLAPERGLGQAALGSVLQYPQRHRMSQRGAVVFGPDFRITQVLGVNLAGVEIVLNMREKMSEMQRQIEQFVSSLNTEISSQRARPTQAREINSLIPVIEVRRPKKSGA